MADYNCKNINNNNFLNIIENNTNDDVCSICIENNKTKQWCSVSCNHKFHTYCILIWLNKKKICPNCKTDLKIISSNKNYLEVDQQIVLEYTLSVMNKLDNENKRLLNDLVKKGYSDIEVAEFKEIRINLRIIKWYLEYYCKITNRYIGYKYFEKLIKYKKIYEANNKNGNLFDINNECSEYKFDYKINGNLLPISLGYANFLCWFFEHDILDNIIDIYKLYLIPVNILYQEEDIEFRY